MAFKEPVNKNNSFEWKIEDLAGKVSHRSPCFENDGCEFYIIAYYEDYSKSDENLWQFVIAPCGLLPLVSYTISIVDSEGQDFITTKGIVQAEEEWHKQILMMLDAAYLKKNNLIVGDSLTVRLNLESYNAQDGK